MEGHWEAVNLSKGRIVSLLLSLIPPKLAFVPMSVKGSISKSNAFSICPSLLSGMPGSIIRTG